MNIKTLIKKMPPFRGLVDQRDEYYYRTLNLEEELSQQRNLYLSFQERIDSMRGSINEVQLSMNLLHNFCQNTKGTDLNNNDLGLFGLYDHSFLHFSESGVVVRLPIELLFTEKSEDAIRKCENENITDLWLRHNQLYADIPLLKLKPHKKLFEYFARGTDTPEDYCKWYTNLFFTRNQQPELSMESLIAKRYDEFIFMQNSLNDPKGGEFFRQHPAVAVWNEKGYFNLLDGHHRAMFLIVSGLRYVPVCVSKQDYYKWRNDVEAIEFKKYVTLSKRNEYYTPIHNPFFMNIQSHRDNFSQSRLYHILNYMQDIQIKGLKVLDIGSCLGYMSQHFYREGADVTCIEPDGNHVEAAELLQKLLYSNCSIKNCGIQEYDTNESFDMCILLTIFYHFYSNPPIRDKFINILNNNVTSFIIWESGDDFDNERQYLLKHTKFKKFTHLAFTYGTGKIRELGIFSI